MPSLASSSLLRCHFLLSLDRGCPCPIRIVIQRREVLAVNGDDAAGQSNRTEHLAAVKIAYPKDQVVQQELRVQAPRFGIQGGVRDGLWHQRLAHRAEMFRQLFSVPERGCIGGQPQLQLQLPLPLPQDGLHAVGDLALLARVRRV